MDFGTPWTLSERLLLNWLVKTCLLMHVLIVRNHAASWTQTSSYSVGPYILRDSYWDEKSVTVNIVGGAWCKELQMKPPIKTMDPRCFFGVLDKGTSEPTTFEGMGHLLSVTSYIFILIILHKSFRRLHDVSPELKDHPKSPWIPVGNFNGSNGAGW